METTTDIVIVSYKDKDDLDKCIASIRKHCTDYRIHLIDNEKNNVGYVAGCNKGIDCGSAPFIWLLNSDAIVLPGCQQAILRRFQETPRAGIVASVQIDPNNEDRVSHAGCTTIFPGGVHICGYFSQGFRPVSGKHIWVNGASMALRRTMVEKIGKPDDRYFMYFSDSDYCLVARLAGWEVWLEAEAKVLHTLKSSRNPSNWLAADAIQFMDKWDIQQDMDGQFLPSHLFQRLSSSAD